MALVHFAHKQSEIPANAVNIQDATEDYRQADSRPDFQFFVYQTHVGLCLEESEYNGRDDSDFYMTLWNPEKGETERVQFATTRGWCAPCFSSKVDATPEVRAAYNAYRERKAEESRKIHEARCAAMPGKGKTLRVIKGRKVPVGTVGPCFWSDTRFKTDKVIGILFLGYEGRVGIETAAGRVFTDAGNVEVVAA